MGKERTASSNEMEKENLHVDEERRTSSNERQYAQWKMDTLSAQVLKHTFQALGPDPSRRRAQIRLGEVSRRLKSYQGPPVFC